MIVDPSTSHVAVFISIHALFRDFLKQVLYQPHTLIMNKQL